MFYSLSLFLDLLINIWTLIVGVMKKFAAPGSHLPKVNNVRRALNARRAKERPQAPPANDPFFKVAEDFFPPDFYRGEIFPPDRSARHLLFATNEQLKYLRNCKRWYLDETFKIVAKPFTQLFTVNGFLKNSKGNSKISLLRKFYDTHLFLCRWSQAVCFRLHFDVSAADGGLRVGFY